MRPLKTRDAQGVEHTFWLEVEDPEPWESSQSWIFRVRRTNPLDPREDFYEAKLTQLPDGETVYTDVLDNHGQSWAKGKGITEAVLEAASEYLSKRIVSSRRYVEGEAEWQTEQVRKMWERFVSQGRARFDSAEGRYVYIPTSDRS